MGLGALATYNPRPFSGIHISEVFYPTDLRPGWAFHGRTGKSEHRLRSCAAPIFCSRRPLGLRANRDVEVLALLGDGNHRICDNGRC
jgi:hypothetical protein